MDRLRQKQIAAKLGVSARTFSLWECDHRIVPAWAFQPRLVAYLGFDPFEGLIPGKPKGNETSGVAFLLPAAPATIGKKILQFRLKSRKTRKQLAKEWGVNIKTLRGGRPTVASRVP
jgi:DNA-binding XRE family transcriptional regulator